MNNIMNITNRVYTIICSYPIEMGTLDDVNKPVTCWDASGMVCTGGRAENPFPNGRQTAFTIWFVIWDDQESAENTDMGQNVAKIGVQGKILTKFAGAQRGVTCVMLPKAFHMHGVARRGDAREPQLLGEYKCKVVLW